MDPSTQNPTNDTAPTPAPGGPTPRTDALDAEVHSGLRRDDNDTATGIRAALAYAKSLTLNRTLETELTASRAEVERVTRERDEAQKERDRLNALVNSPELIDFQKGVVLEAAHQRERWGSDHDAGKTEPDWFWLVGYVAGKALSKPEKRLHHIITTAAVCANWHAAALGKDLRNNQTLYPKP